MRSSGFVVAGLVLTSAIAAQTQWVQQAPAVSPEGRCNHGLAFDAARGEIVLFGGGCVGSTLKLGDTWVWNCSVWTQRSPVNQPPPRNAHGMAYDSARQRVVLYGGVGANGVLLTDTWEWDGVDWQPRTPAHAPGVYEPGSMAYDSARGVVVLFGGYRTAGGLSAETWLWDGTDWIQRTPAHAPSARSRCGMAFDSRRGRMVLFGGHADPSTLDDTWEWTGADWLRLSPATSPPARGSDALAFDLARGRTVLFGGDTLHGALGDTWEWDGAQWSEQVMPIAPAPRIEVRLAYDVLRNVSVLFGGASAHGTVPYDETWTYGMGGIPAAYGTFGVGCAGSAGTPSLSAQGAVPLIGEPFTVYLADLPADQATLMLVGTSRTAMNGFQLPLELSGLGMPGCTLYVSCDFSMPLFNWAGSAMWMVMVPNEPSLIGASFYNQALVIDRVANPLGAILTNAGEGVIGCR